MKQKEKDDYEKGNDIVLHLHTEDDEIKEKEVIELEDGISDDEIEDADEGDDEIVETTFGTNDIDNSN